MLEWWLFDGKSHLTTIVGLQQQTENCFTWYQCLFVWVTFSADIALQKTCEAVYQKLDFVYLRRMRTLFKLFVVVNKCEKVRLVIKIGFSEVNKKICDVKHRYINYRSTHRQRFGTVCCSNSNVWHTVCIFVAPSFSACQGFDSSAIWWHTDSLMLSWINHLWLSGPAVNMHSATIFWYILAVRNKPGWTETILSVTVFK